MGIQITNVETRGPQRNLLLFEPESCRPKTVVTYCVLSLFNLDSNLDVNINPLVNLSNLQIRSRYFSPHSFVQTISKISQNALLSSFSIFHNNVVSLNGNLENLQTHILEELEFHFDVLEISENKVTNSNVDILTPLILNLSQHLWLRGVLLYSLMKNITTEFLKKRPIQHFRLYG